MFQTVIEQIKAWAKEHGENKQRTPGANIISPALNLPSLMLVIWCICALFFGTFTFDPTYAINYPRIAAFFGLVYLAGKDYLLVEKEIAARKNE